MSTPNIYDRWDDAAPFERLQFRSDRILQSAEMNELQSSLRHRLRGIADVMMADGDVMRAAGITVDQVSGHTVCEAGAIYADGAVRGVPPATITIPTQGDVHVGVYLRAETVTELVSIRARHCWRAMRRGDQALGVTRRFNPRPPLLAGDA